MKTIRQAGQGMVEYALILILVAIGAFIILQLMGVSLSDVYCRAAGGFTNNTCQAATAGTPTGTQATDPFCVDDFSDPSQWQNQNGTWKSSKGRSCIKGGGSMLNTCSLNNQATDYVTQVDGAVLSNGKGYGIFFRASDAGLGTNGYVFQYDAGAGDFVIRKWVNGREIYPTLAHVQYPSIKFLGSKHSLSVQVVGDTFTGMVDGQPVITATDDTYTSGGAGIRTWGAKTNFCLDSFTVSPPAP